MYDNIIDVFLAMTQIVQAHEFFAGCQMSHIETGSQYGFVIRQNDVAIGTDSTLGMFGFQYRGQTIDVFNAIDDLIIFLHNEEKYLKKPETTSFDWFVEGF